MRRRCAPLPTLADVERDKLFRRILDLSMTCGCHRARAVTPYDLSLSTGRYLLPRLGPHEFGLSAMKQP
jgi:hypothetical protein